MTQAGEINLRLAFPITDGMAGQTNRPAKVGLVHAGFASGSLQFCAVEQVRLQRFILWVAGIYDV